MDSPASGKLNISGIVLHVDAYGEYPAEVLSFRKASSRTISVGRRSSSGRVLPDDAGRALFRCPVVSRKHAKITFTEYGNVYLIDLHSHHGTHILRPGELMSTALKPEVPTVLADGDLITFGKAVGRDTYLVRPVVARVELMFGRDASPVAPSPLPSSLTGGDLSSFEKDKAPARSASGRYGVYPPSPESSSSASASDGDSDIQEISPPSSPPDPASSFPRPLSRSNSMSLQSLRLRLLQSILPPIQWMPDQLFEEIDETFMEGGQVVHPAVLEEEEGEDMDLSSSRSASPAENREGEVTMNGPHEEPPVIGAWPGSPLNVSESSDEPPAEHPSVHMLEPRDPLPGGLSCPEVIEISDDDYGTPFPPAAERAAPVDLTVGEIEDEGVDTFAEVPNFVPMDDAFLRQVETIVDASVRVHEMTNDPAAPKPEARVPEVQAQTAEILNELNVIKSRRVEDETAFSTHVQQTKDRLNALHGQMLDTCDRLSARDDQLTSIQSKLHSLGALVNDLQERSTLAEREAARMEELVMDVSVAKEMLKETCDLQKDARTQMLAELEAVKALREEAAAAVAEVKAAASTVATAASTLITLKRKRDDADADIAFPDPNLARAVAPLPSKRRRTMQVVSTVVQTATVASMGAVAAWAALAFS
ncbi:hypothetical protein BD414DRAFT_503173 [Trametes punicea]|nr:hypothetical protein BD414DRAFT_503173 [Trametes punicea]